VVGCIGGAEDDGSHPGCGLGDMILRTECSGINAEPSGSPSAPAPAGSPAALAAAVAGAYNGHWPTEPAPPYPTSGGGAGRQGGPGNRTASRAWKGGPQGTTFRPLRSCLGCGLVIRS